MKIKIDYKSLSSVNAGDTVETIHGNTEFITSKEIKHFKAGNHTIEEHEICGVYR